MQSPQIIYELSESIISYFGYWSSLLLPLSVLTLTIIRQLRKYSFDLPILAVILSTLPALTPFLTIIFDFQYFTRLNYDLQNDQNLVVAATILITLFGLFFMLGVSIRQAIPIAHHNRRHIFSNQFLIVFFILNFTLMIWFLESGTILNQTYGQIKLENPSEYGSLVNQFFNASVAMLVSYLGYKKQRNRIILVFFTLMLIFLLLASRRTLAISIVVLSIYFFSANRITVKQILLLVIALGLLVFIGEARSVGIINYLNGLRLQSSETFFTLPGGASNVFVGTMGIIHMLGRNILVFPETMPIIMWPTGTYEASIYDSFDYNYNGGMHIANVLFWNFGLPGIMLGGILLGWLTKRAHIVMRRIKYDLGGTLKAMLSIAYVLTLPNLIWYHPIATINVTIAICCGFFLLTVVKNLSYRKISTGNAGI